MQWVGATVDDAGSGGGGMAHLDETWTRLMRLRVEVGDLIASPVLDLGRE